MAINKLNNTTAGLAGLLQGINSGRQQTLQNQLAIAQLQNQNQTTQWANPYRPVGALDTLKVDSNPINQLIKSAVATGAIPSPGASSVAQNPSQAIGSVVGQGQANMAQAQQAATPVAIQPYTGSYKGDVYFSAKTGKHYDAQGNEV